MNVLLIQQDMGMRGENCLVFPIGLTYIAASLKKHRVSIFDPNIYPLDEAADRLEKKLVSFNPDIIGISIRNIDSVAFRTQLLYFNTVKPMLETIKAVSPNAMIMVGGAGFSLFPYPIMKRFPEIDFGVFLEGEESTPELLDNLDHPENVKGIFIRRMGEVIFTGKRPVPDFSKPLMTEINPEVLNMDQYVSESYPVIGIQSKRGCSLRCLYCSYPYLNGKKSRLRDPADIADQIEYMTENFGMKYFCFADSVFNVPGQHAVNICNEIIKRKIGIKFAAWCHPKGFTEEFMCLLKKAGAAQIDFSPDAAINKGFDVLRKGITEEDLENTVEVIKSVKGVGFAFFFFSAVPGFSAADRIRTLFNILKIRLKTSDNCRVFLNNYIRIEPNTVIREIAVKEGMINEHDDLLPNDAETLKKTFYRPRGQKLLNNICERYASFLAKSNKPPFVLSED
jgi:radical SAM superfamily enzyme YgiQ (UPF0313 family)